MERYCRQGHWLNVICVFLFLAAGCSTQTQVSSKKDSLSAFTNRIFSDLPKNIIEDSKDTFSQSDNFIALLAAGAASIAMNQGADNDIAESFDRHKVFGKFMDNTLNSVGSPGTHFAAAGLWYVLSAQNQDDFNQERAWAMIRALSVTGFTTAGLKAIRNNDTPDGKNWAWPSGHASSSFTVASVLDEFYGPEVGLPAYAVASLVSLRMLDQGDHWASDIVFGAVLGWVVGHTVGGSHKNAEIAGFKITPYTMSSHGPVMGVGLIKQF